MTVASRFGELTTSPSEARRRSASRTGVRLTPNREAFMANFSPAIRARYQTPERVCAVGVFGVGFRGPDPMVAVQVVSVAEDHGPDQVKIKLWMRNTSGRESAGGDTYVRTPDGWTSKPTSLTKESLLKWVLPHLDPATGDYVPEKK